MTKSFTSIDLSGGRPPKEFWIPQVDDRSLEEWRADESICKNYTIKSSNWCAMTVLWMLLTLHGRKPNSLEELFDAACLAGVYEWQEDVKGHGPGWFGAKLAELPPFIESLGYEVHLKKEIHTNDLVQGLHDGWFVVPNVSPEIRFPNEVKDPEQKTGHFVLIYAYEHAPLPAFRIQNGSGFESENSQIGVSISWWRMQQVFSGMAFFIRERR